MIYKINQLREEITKYNGFKEELYILSRTNNYIQDADIINIYFKNLFVDGKYSELYVFLVDKLYVFSYLEEGKSKLTKVVVRKLSNVESFEVIDEETQDIQSKLKITFSDGYIVDFDNIRDTNNHHSHKFRIVIKDIIKQLNS